MHTEVHGALRSSKAEAENNAAEVALMHLSQRPQVPRCTDCAELKAQLELTRSQLKQAVTYLERVAELHNALMHALNGNEQVGRWYEIVNGKSILCHEAVEESLNRLANLVAAAPRSDKRLVVYAVTCAALGEGVRAVDSAFEDEFDSELADLHRDVKYRERVVRAASKKVNQQRRAAKEARDREGADATFQPDDDAASMRRHIRAVTQIINDFESKPTRRFASMLRHQLLDGKILEAIRVKLGSSSGLTPSTLDDVVRRWFAGGYQTSSTFMKHLCSVEATVKAEFPDGYSGMTQIPADPSRLLSAWAESHNSKMHALFGNILMPLDFADPVQVMLDEASPRYIETLFEKFEHRASQYTRFRVRPNPAQCSDLKQRFNAIVCEIMSQGADGYLERLAAARNKLMHALNGNTETAAASVALLANPVEAPSEVRTADVASVDQVVSAKFVSDIQVNAAALQLEETGGNGVGKLTRAMAHLIAKAFKKRYDLPTTPSRSAVNALWGTYQKVRNWESAFSQFGMPLERPEFGFLTRVLGSDGIQSIFDISTDVGNPVSPDVYVTVEPSQGIIAERIILSQAGTALNEASSAPDFSNLSNPLRTNNAIYNMQAFLALMSYAHATVTSAHTGLPASAAPFYLRAMQNICVRLPLATPAVPTWDFGFVPDIDIPPNFDPVMWPLSSDAAAAAVNVNAVLVSMDFFVQWLKGSTGATANYQPTELDRNCVVIPLTDDMITNPEALAAWTMCHLESPVRMVSYLGTIGVGLPNPTSAIHFASTVRVPGVRNNVMYVYMPGNATNGLSVNVNGMNVPLTPNAAGPVNIGPALYALAANPNISPFMLAYQYGLRAYGTGNGHDIAMIVAADTFWRHRRAPVVVAEVKEGELTTAANTSGEISAVYGDWTTATLAPGSSILLTRRLQRVAARIPALSSIAAVLMAGNFAKPATTSVFGTQMNAATLVLRLNDVARYFGHRSDLVAAALNLTTEALYHCGDAPAGPALNYRTMISYNSDGKGPLTLYNAINVGFKGIQWTMIPILDHSNPVTFALWPSAAWTPVSRFGSWVEAELESIEWEQTGLPHKGAICGPDLLASPADIKAITTGANQQIRYVLPAPLTKSMLAVTRRQLLCSMRNGPVFYIPNERAVAAFQVATPYTPAGWNRTFRAAIFQWITLPTQASATDIPHGAIPLATDPSNKGTLSIGVLNIPELWLNRVDRTLSPFGMLELGRLGYFSSDVQPNTDQFNAEQGEL